MSQSETIWEWFKSEEKKIEEARQHAMLGLKIALSRKQAMCPHKKETRYEGLFYALGETYPGYKCDYCGKERNA